MVRGRVTTQSDTRNPCGPKDIPQAVQPHACKRASGLGQPQHGSRGAVQVAPSYRTAGMCCSCSHQPPHLPLVDGLL